MNRIFIRGTAAPRIYDRDTASQYYLKLCIIFTKTVNAIWSYLNLRRLPHPQSSAYCLQPMVHPPYFLVPRHFLELHLLRSHLNLNNMMEKTNKCRLLVNKETSNMSTIIRLVRNRLSWDFSFTSSAIRCFIANLRNVPSSPSPSFPEQQSPYSASKSWSATIKSTCIVEWAELEEQNYRAQ